MSQDALVCPALSACLCPPLTLSRPWRNLARAAETGAKSRALGLGVRDEHRAQRSASARPGGKRDSVLGYDAVLLGVKRCDQGGMKYEQV